MQRPLQECLSLFAKLLSTEKPCLFQSKHSRPKHVRLQGKITFLQSFVILMQISTLFLERET